MLDNGEEIKPYLIHWSTKAPAFKMPNDPRVPRIGRHLRKFSIGELAQLSKATWLILCSPRLSIPT